MPHNESEYAGHQEGSKPRPTQKGGNAAVPAAVIALAAIVIVWFFAYSAKDAEYEKRFAAAMNTPDVLAPLEEENEDEEEVYKAAVRGQSEALNDALVEVAKTLAASEHERLVEILTSGEQVSAEIRDEAHTFYDLQRVLLSARTDRKIDEGLEVFSGTGSEKVLMSLEDNREECKRTIEGTLAALKSVVTEAYAGRRAPTEDELARMKSDLEDLYVLTRH